MATAGHRVTEYLLCPDCTKRGVTHRMTSSEDYWGCRYCDWSAFSFGEDTMDRAERQRLAAINPTKDIWVTNLAGEDY